MSDKKLNFRVSDRDLKALIMAKLLRLLKHTNIQGLVDFPSSSSFNETKAERAREALVKEFSRRTECLRGKTFFPEESYK
jgi:hypothetical protein